MAERSWGRPRSSCPWPADMVGLNAALVLFLAERHHLPHWGGRRCGATNWTEYVPLDRAGPPWAREHTPQKYTLAPVMVHLGGETVAALSIACRCEESEQISRWRCMWEQERGTFPPLCMHCGVLYFTTYTAQPFKPVEACQRSGSLCFLFSHQHPAWHIEAPR